MPLNINFQQILLHALNFVILAVGLYVLLYGPVVKFMDKRRAYFADMEKKYGKEAGAVLKEYAILKGYDRK